MEVPVTTNSINMIANYSIRSGKEYQTNLENNEDEWDNRRHELQNKCINNCNVIKPLKGSNRNVYNISNCNNKNKQNKKVESTLPQSINYGYLKEEKSLFYERPKLTKPYKKVRSSLTLYWDVRKSLLNGHLGKQQINEKFVRSCEYANFDVFKDLKWIKSDYKQYGSRNNRRYIDDEGSGATDTEYCVRKESSSRRSGSKTSGYGKVVRDIDWYTNRGKTTDGTGIRPKGEGRRKGETKTGRRGGDKGVDFRRGEEKSRSRKENRSSKAIKDCYQITGSHKTAEENKESERIQRGTKIEEVNETKFEQITECGIGRGFSTGTGKRIRNRTRSRTRSRCANVGGTVWRERRIFAAWRGGPGAVGKGYLEQYSEKEGQDRKLHSDGPGNAKMLRQHDVAEQGKDLERDEGVAGDCEVSELKLNINFKNKLQQVLEKNSVSNERNCKFQMSKLSLEAPDQGGKTLMSSENEQCISNEVIKSVEFEMAKKQAEILVKNLKNKKNNDRYLRNMGKNGKLVV